MAKFVCTICGYTYDEQEGNEAMGVAPGTLWAVVPDDFVCPICGADKSAFEAEE